MQTPEAIFKAFNNLNILIVGDVMIDRYLTGQVSRISPEAPVPVVHYRATDNRLGGAANVALNIAAMGAKPYLCSVVGDDENGQLFQEILPKNNIIDTGIITSKYRQTTVKTRVIAGNQHLLRVDREDTHALNDDEEKALLERIVKLLDSKPFHLILFQDYNKGVLTPSFIRSLTYKAIQLDIPTAVDPKKANFWAYKQVTLFKPNLKEIRESLSLTVEPNVSSLREAGKAINDKLKNTYALITLSEHGLYLDTPEKGELFPTQPRSIVDVCGAGDTVISVAGLGLALGLTMEKVAVLANLAGGQVCEKVGVVPVDKAQLLQEWRLIDY